MINVRKSAQNDKKNAFYIFTFKYLKRLLGIQYLLDPGHLGAVRAPLIHFLPDSGLILLQLFNLPDQLKKIKLSIWIKKWGQILTSATLKLRGCKIKVNLAVCWLSNTSLTGSQCLITLPDGVFTSILGGVAMFCMGDDSVLLLNSTSSIFQLKINVL